MGEQTLLLDSSLRNWVLLPILLVMVLVGLLRHYVSILLQATPKPQDPRAVREQGALARASLLRASGHHLPAEAFLQRQAFLIDAFGRDVYLKDPSAKGRPAANPMTDPSAMDGMMNMMKGNMANMVPQMGLMYWVNFFFSGFVLLKLPFPLTLRFKQMLQSGVMTHDLDVTWVSSLSWYFLNLFGLQFVYALLLGDDNAAGSANDMNQMGPGAMPSFGPGQDPAKMFAAEVENLEVASSQWINRDVTKRMLARFAQP